MNNKKYDPFLNGDASYFNGTFEFEDGLKVEIDTRLSFVVVTGIYEKDAEYVFQGDEADELITNICKYWKNNYTIPTNEAIHYVVNHL